MTSLIESSLSNTTLKTLLVPDSSLFMRSFKPFSKSKKLLSFTKIHIMEILIETALSVFKMLDSIATPSSVKTKGLILRPILIELEVPNWYLQFLSSY